MLAKLLFTAWHSPTLILANTMPSFSWVGIWSITASSLRSFTSQETTGNSLMGAPICPADRSSRAVRIIFDVPDGVLGQQLPGHEVRGITDLDAHHPAA